MVLNGAIRSTLLSTILLDTCTLVNQKRDVKTKSDTRFGISEPNIGNNIKHCEVQQTKTFFVGQCNT